MSFAYVQSAIFKIHVFMKLWGYDVVHALKSWKLKGNSVEIGNEFPEF